MRGRGLRNSVEQRVIALRADGYSLEVIARMTFVSRGLVHSIVRGLMVDPLTVRKPPPDWLKMGRAYRVWRKPHPLRWQEREALRLRALGFSYRMIAERIELKEGAVRAIIRRHGHDPIVRPTWKGSMQDLLLAHKASDDMGAHDDKGEDK